MDAEIPAGAAGGDDDLLASARRGDADALERLLVRYHPLLYRYGLRMCRNPDDAGEIAQESLMAMARALPGFRGESSVSTWLYTIARRFCVRKRRRFPPARQVSIDDPGHEAHAMADPRPGPEHVAAGRELETGLVAAIDALEPGQREVLILRDVEGLPAAEVAKVLGVSVDAVKSRLHRARTAVRRRLARLVDGLPADGPPTPTCPDVPSLFSQYLEGEVNPAACAQMEAHLAGCARCQGACDALKRTLAACRQLPVPDVPPETASAVRQAIRAVLSRA